MKVWVFVEGFEYEGDDADSMVVFASEAAAKAHELNTHDHKHFGMSGRTYRVYEMEVRSA